MSNGEYEKVVLAAEVNDTFEQSMNYNSDSYNSPVKQQNPLIHKLFYIRIGKLDKERRYELPLGIQLYKKTGNEYIYQDIYNKQFKNNLQQTGFGDVTYHSDNLLDQYYVNKEQLKNLIDPEKQVGGKRLSRKQKRSRNKPKKSRKARSKSRH